MGFFAFTSLFQRAPRKNEDTSDAERAYTLRLFLSDALCELLVEEQSGKLVSRINQRDTAPPANPKALLTAVLCRLPKDIEDRIGNVIVFLDDPEITVVDSRQVKLTNFEGRALSEFGKYQLGGKPISFASLAYGMNSVQEAEKRIIGFIPEERLSMVLFALGKLAKYITFCGPWWLQSALGAGQAEPKATLTMHGHFSTLTISNSGAGAVAIRHLPIGTSTLVTAYADGHGLSFAEACAALQSRSRFTVTPDTDSPAAHVASYLALRPIFDRLTEEVSATTDYFEFQRLAGRAASLNLCVTGDAIVGLGGWLSSLLQIEVKMPDLPDISVTAVGSALNFLEGMRSGLLKLGNQLYDFSAGHFVPSGSKTAPARGGIANDHLNSPILQRLKDLSARPVTQEDLRGIAPVLCLAGLLFLFGFLADLYWLAPISNDLSASANNYETVLAEASTRAPSPVASAPEEPVLWARDIIAIGSAMPYDMKLTHIEMSTTRSASDSTLELTGTLPRGGSDNLQLIGAFMSRLASKNKTSRHFSEFSFSGAGDIAGATANAAPPEDGAEMQFRLSSKLQAKR